MILTLKEERNESSPSDYSSTPSPHYGEPTCMHGRITNFIWWSKLSWGPSKIDGYSDSVQQFILHALDSVVAIIKSIWNPHLHSIISLKGTSSLSRFHTGKQNWKISTVVNYCWASMMSRKGPMVLAIQTLTWLIQWWNGHPPFNVSKNMSNILYTWSSNTAIWGHVITTEPIRQIQDMAHTCMN